MRPSCDRLDVAAVDETDDTVDEAELGATAPSAFPEPTSTGEPLPSIERSGDVEAPHAPAARDL